MILFLYLYHLESEDEHAYWEQILKLGSHLVMYFGFIWTRSKLETSGNKSLITPPQPAFLEL